MTELIRARTELECVVDDLRSANDRAGGKRTEYEEELANIDAQIAEKEDAVAELLPQWESQRAQQSEHRRALDDARGRLKALHSKRGRTGHFRTRAERDAYLRQEIASVEAHQRTQTAALDAAREELNTVRGSLADVDTQLQGIDGRTEEARARVREIGEELIRLQEEKTQKTEQRKDLWREDAKLDTTSRHARDELRAAERTLAGMMDKVNLD